MFDIGDLVKHPIYECYGIIINKDDQRCLEGTGACAYYITWVEDKFTPQSWEFSEDLILAAGVNDERHI